jgi:hypothetical protein
MEIWNGSRPRRSEVDRRSFGSRADSRQAARKNEGRAGGGRAAKIYFDVLDAVKKEQDKRYTPPTVQQGR